MATPLYYPPTQNGLQKSLNANLDQAETASLTLNNTTGIQDKPGLIVVDRIDTNGDEKSSALREYIAFTGVSGATLTGLTRGLGGSTDQDHATGAVVEFIPDIVWAQMITDALNVLVSSSDVTVVNTTNVVTPTGTQTLTNKTINSATLATASLINPTITGSINKPSVLTLLGTATDMNLNLGNEFKTTLVGNTTFTVSNETVGQCFLLEVTQDAGGSGYTITWPSTVHWVGGTAPTQTATASAVDLYGFRVKATDTYQGYVIGQDVKAVA